MLIDILCAVLWLFAAWTGWRKGFFSSIVSFLGLFLGLLVAMKFSALAEEYLRKEYEIASVWAPLAAFIFVLVGVWLLLNLLAKVMTGLTDMMMMGWANKTAGMVVQVLYYTLWMSGFFYFAPRLSLFSAETIQASFFYKWVQPLGPFVFDQVGEWIPFFRNAFPD